MTPTASLHTLTNTTSRDSTWFDNSELLVKSIIKKNLVQSKKQHTAHLCDECKNMAQTVMEMLTGQQVRTTVRIVKDSFFISIHDEMDLVKMSFTLARKSTVNAYDALTIGQRNQINNIVKSMCQDTVAPLYGDVGGELRWSSGSPVVGSMGTINNTNINVNLGALVSWLTKLKFDTVKL